MTTSDGLAAALAVALSCGACGDDDGAAPGASPPAVECPDGLAPDADRARRVVARLRSVPEGADALDALDGEPAICFGDADPSVVTADGVLWLDGRMGTREAAARVAHLLHHVAAMPDLDHPPSESACERLVADAMRVERESLRLERDLRRELGVVDPVTDPHTQGLEEAYLQRCQLAAHSAGAAGD